MKNFVVFLSHYFRNPKAVGGFMGLSPAAANRLLKYVKNRPLNHPAYILEVGAGTGNVTRPLVNLLQKGDVLDIIEIDSHCCDILRKKYAGDPRIHIHNLSITDWHPPYKYDYIISTLPFNIFSPEFIQKVINLYRNLSTDSTICAYVEYIGLQKLNRLFAKRAARELISTRQRLIKEYHKHYLIEKSEVLANILPLHVYHMNLGKKHKTALHR